MFYRSRTSHPVPSRRSRMRLVGIALAVVATGALGACSSDGGSDVSGSGAGAASSTSVVAGSHNAADVTFSTDMIPHHRQAVEMAELASTRAADPRVTDLATQIAAAQTPEIAELSNRLRSWGESVPSDTDMGHSMNPESKNTGSMSGMMSAGDMAELESLRGTAFDTKWLTMMISHHTGAITMARTEIATGADQASKTLAENIVASQKSQITTMEKILAG